MKILLYSSSFSPAVGGVETVSHVLARNLVRLGHECVVLTETTSESDARFECQVIRRPSFVRRARLVRWAQVVHSNGASLPIALLSLILARPFVWTHQGYQLSCLDGLGWLDGELAPLTPWRSFVHHLGRRFPLSVVAEGAKLVLRRAIARKIALNVAISEWVKMRQPLPRQAVIYNPFPTDEFRGASTEAIEFDFVFVGRMVAEKGLSLLLKALRRVLDDCGDGCTLAVVGDGPARSECEALAVRLGLGGNVSFLGQRRGDSLRAIVRRSRIGVVPSVYEEPMGGVAVEMMAAGIPVVVSRRGGLAECVGEAGIVFENGDDVDLARAMKAVLTDDALRSRLAANCLGRSEKFDELTLARSYVAAYRMAAGLEASLEPTP